MRNIKDPDSLYIPTDQVTPPSTHKRRSATNYVPMGIVVLIFTCIIAGYLKPRLWDTTGFNSLIAALAGGVAGMVVPISETDTYL